MKKLLLFVFTAFAFAACEQAPVEEVQGIAMHDRSLEVSFEDDDDTRIQLNEAQKTVWTKGDHVSVFYLSIVNEQWRFDGDTGDRVGNIVPVDNSVNPPATHNRVVVVYPYNEGYFLNTETYSIEASLPAVQNYLKDSYGTNGNIMVSSSDYKQVSLKSVCGWLKLQLMGDGEVVKSITLRGNNGEQLAGELHINTSDATSVLASASGDAGESEVGGTLVRPGTILTEVTLDCGEGVELGKNATAFYIALPPQTFEAGITIEITDSEDFTMVQSTDKIITIDRNYIQPMAAIQFSNPNTPTEPTPASNEIWYTATAEVEPYFDDSITFGANVISNVWDSETKRGIITFEGDVTIIGESAFYNCDNLTGITLPECVISIGTKAFYDCDDLTDFTIPDSVTEIGTSSFYSCGKLANVTIGDRVAEIGNSAFYSCTNLTSITIPDSVTKIGDSAFYSCQSLTSVSIGNCVAEIGDCAFYWCDSLTSVIIPYSVTTIGDKAFASCDSLTEFKGKFAEDNGRILVIDGVLTAFAHVGITEYTIPNSITEIGNSAFYSCTNLTSITIPDSVTKIGDSAFQGCKSLTSVTIPDSVTKICDSAFQGCKNLTSVSIGNCVAEIGNSAFASCDNLTSVTIPDSVTTIGGQAFYWCHSLKKVYCKATTPPSLGSDAFFSNASERRIYVYEECVEPYKSAWNSYKDSIYTNGQNCQETITIEYTTSDDNTITSSKLPIISNIYENGVGTMVIAGKLIPVKAFYYCDSLTSITIPDSVSKIGDSAFQGCKNLTSVSIGNCVAEIGNSAFASCDNLTSVTIPDSVTTIGDSAFYSCSLIENITIGTGIVFIDCNAFKYCSSLKNVYINSLDAPILGTCVFSCCHAGCVFKVSKNTYSNYKTEPTWIDYAHLLRYEGIDRPSENYVVGDIVTINGTLGIVYYASEDIIRIMSIREGSKYWSSEHVATNAISYHNGIQNMVSIKSIEGWEEKYPAFKWCADLGESWYLPACDELYGISQFRDTINTILSRHIGYPRLVEIRSYWSSTEHSKNDALVGAGGYISSKDYARYVRAVVVL